MARRGARVAQEVAAAGDRLKSVSYRDNYLSGCQRPWKTKDGSWTVRSLDVMGFEDFSKTLNASSDEMRAKPCNGVSEAAATFKDSVNDLRTFQTKAIVGDGLNPLLTLLEKQRPVFETLDSFGSEVRRDREHLSAAVEDFVTLFQKLGGNQKARALVCDLRQCSVRMAHLAQWLHSSMSMCEDPIAYGKSVPRADMQHGGTELKHLCGASRSEGKANLVKFLTAALLDKNGVKGKPRAPADLGSYADMDLEAEPAAADGAEDELLEADELLAAPASPPQESSTRARVKKAAPGETGLAQDVADLKTQLAALVAVLGAGNATATASSKQDAGERKKSAVVVEAAAAPATRKSQKGATEEENRASSSKMQPDDDLLSATAMAKDKKKKSETAWAEAAAPSDAEPRATKKKANFESEADSGLVSATAVPKDKKQKTADVRAQQAAAASEVKPRMPKKKEPSSEEEDVDEQQARAARRARRVLREA